MQDVFLFSGTIRQNIKCTQIVIVHRLSTIQDADLILVLDRGEIVEQGTHAILLNQEGAYSELVRSQSDD
ncbi:MAG: hypothetical protein AAF702_06965 [Chloroflexota bacterium]